MSQELERQTVVLVHLPPRDLPVHMPLDAYGQHGYWFAPANPPPPDMQFHLLAEGAPDQWAYLGCFSSSPFVGGDMSIAEWSCLDFATQHAYCQRRAAESVAQGKATSADAEGEALTLRRKHDTGEMRVPCFYLRCVGFSMALHEALRACLPSTPMTPDLVFGVVAAQALILD
ncbi:hypothetical protein CONPUDRAFT_164641 [Coniophora puteana RWD-64-598 SS2]|uniref:DUF6697 domain-containing protein n=1 Tax=Coniophora puteana (strain RWD-64-598) TaxID=741705 RepID=A0A5M3MS60_CONPW|nr:uncharacterized protein CONPUDRAFT_164641 [Coniophora puteana RWD-64-598 SS2]EIW81926.1 hypothetical protein CONPUDRAFT_164641 [Coniophora puteana RWD-64-598 SS2]